VDLSVKVCQLVKLLESNSVWYTEAVEQSLHFGVSFGDEKEPLVVQDDALIDVLEMS
jgi:hypothetical protein